MEDLSAELVLLRAEVAVRVPTALEALSAEIVVLRAAVQDVRAHVLLLGGLPGLRADLLNMQARGQTTRIQLAGMRTQMRVLSDETTAMRAELRLTLRGARASFRK